MMYPRTLSLLAPAAFLVLTGCDCSPLTVSLNPLVGDKDAVSEPAIVGTWQETDGSGHLVIRATGPAEYEIGDPENDEKDVWRLRLIRLNGELLADVSAKKSDSFLLVHIFVRVRADRDWLRLALFNSEWLRNEIIQPDGPAHAVLEEGCDVVLTGSTAELQRFVGRYVYTPQAFGDDEAEYRRLTSGETKQE